MKTLSKAEKKALKSVYIIHLCVNTLNEYGLYDYVKARRKAISIWYWQKQMSVTVLN